MTDTTENPHLVEAFTETLRRRAERIESDALITYEPPVPQGRGGEFGSIVIERGDAHVHVSPIGQGWRVEYAPNEYADTTVLTSPDHDTGAMYVYGILTAL